MDVVVIVIFIFRVIMILVVLDIIGVQKGVSEPDDENNHEAGSAADLDDIWKKIEKVQTDQTASSDQEQSFRMSFHTF